MRFLETRERLVVHLKFARFDCLDGRQYVIWQLAFRRRDHLICRSRKKPRRHRRHWRARLNLVVVLVAHGGTHECRRLAVGHPAAEARGQQLSCEGHCLRAHKRWHLTLQDRATVPPTGSLAPHAARTTQHDAHAVRQRARQPVE